MKLAIVDLITQKPEFHIGDVVTMRPSPLAKSSLQILLGADMPTEITVLHSGFKDFYIQGQSDLDMIAAMVMLVIDAEPVNGYNRIFTGSFAVANTYLLLRK